MTLVRRSLATGESPQHMNKNFSRFQPSHRARALAGVLALLAGSMLARPAVAAEGVLTEHANNDVSNVASLQRGARNFVNYCMGCHSAQYVRYNRLAADLRISEADLVANLMFAAEKPQETMTIAMRPADAAHWFGQAPPDLSLIARYKGPDYIYNYLHGFYVDPSRPTGVNNLMLPNTAMPHVLWELQGMQDCVWEDVRQGAATEKKCNSFKQVTPGKLSKEEYDQFVRDLVDFFAYVGEPMQLERQRLGVWVLGFLLLFGILAYLLKREIWKDVK
jgi:ubiquinol-cytochrome c reductase cytochrome c1 subunit